MKTEYRVEPSGNQFTVIDPWEEKVGTYLTEDAAQQDIERCKLVQLSGCDRFRSEALWTFEEKQSQS